MPNFVLQRYKISGMKILIVDEMHESIVKMPSELGLEVDYMPHLELDQIKNLVGNYEGLIIRSKFSIDSAFLSHATNLKFIGRAGAGLDLIDTAACEKAGIEVFGANEANKVAVAEHLIGMLLSLLHKVAIGNFQVKQGLWKREENRGEELFGKIVAIIGFGNNGQATAERLAAFGCKILAFDKFKYGFGNHLIEECEMTDIYRRADIVSLHIPLTKDTQGMVHYNWLKQFQKPIYFCNIARGEIVNLKDLVRGIQDKLVLGACLDVLENEKLISFNEQEKEVFDDLCSFPNVLLTPHVAGWSNESYVKINDVLRDKIKRFIKKKGLQKQPFS